MSDPSSTMPLATAHTAYRAALLGFLDAVEELDEWALLDASRCHGWARLDLVTHVVFGLHELLVGLVSPTDEAPDVDADSFWSAFTVDVAGADPVTELVNQRRRSGLYARPADAVAELRTLTTAAVSGIDALADHPVRWWGHRFTAGDYLAVWTVEAVVHHLDLHTERPAPADALALTRGVVVRRAAERGAVVPTTAPDDEVVLVGAGRIAPPAAWGVEATAFPVVG